MNVICIDAELAGRPAVQFAPALHYLARYVVVRDIPPHTVCARCGRPDCRLYRLFDTYGEWCERRFVRAAPEIGVVRPICEEVDA